VLARSIIKEKDYNRLSFLEDFKQFMTTPGVCLCLRLSLFLFVCGCVVLYHSRFIDFARQIEGSHNDVYADAFLRQFFYNHVVLGKDLQESVGEMNHDTPATVSTIPPTYPFLIESTLLYP